MAPAGVPLAPTDPIAPDAMGLMGPPGAPPMQMPGMPLNLSKGSAPGPPASLTIMAPPPGAGADDSWGQQAAPQSWDSWNSWDGGGGKGGGGCKGGWDGW